MVINNDEESYSSEELAVINHATWEYMCRCCHNFDIFLGSEYWSKDVEDQSEEVKQKYKESCLVKYGVECTFQAEQVKEKIKLVLLEKYGVEYISQSVEIREKIKQTSLYKYGYENISQSPEIKEKKRQTFIALKNRPTVIEITRYKEKFNPKLPHYWYHKKQDILDDILAQLKIIYGKVD